MVDARRLFTYSAEARTRADALATALAIADERVALRGVGLERASARAQERRRAGVVPPVSVDTPPHWASWIAHDLS